MLSVLLISLLHFASIEVRGQLIWNSGSNQPPVQQTFSVSGLGQQVSGWSSQNTQSDKQQASSGNEDPLEALLAMAAMPKEIQLAFLEGIGEQLKEQTGQACNVYGGVESCMTLPSDSEFARLCPNHDLKVDCAFYSEDMQEVQFNPVGDIKKAIEAAQEQDIEDKCPECFENQLQWFCSSVVPKCGSVRASLESAILPAISKVIQAHESGKGWGAALSAAVPSLVKANSLGLPCREMCHDLMETCACGEDKTFGQLLESYSDTLTGEPLPAAFSMQLFDGLRNTSFCSLYSPSSQQGFSGTCLSLPHKCTDRSGWCDSSNPAPAVASQIMASQLADSVFGFMSSWSQNSLGIVTKKAQSPATMEANEKYIRKHEAQVPGSSGSSNWLWALGGALVALAAVGLYLLYDLVHTRIKSKRGDTVKYIPMADADNLLESEEDRI